MNFHRATLETCEHVAGTVVVIDVLRAFSTAAYAFGRGVRQILLVSTVTEALNLRSRYPGYLVMGEVGGLPVAGFDFSNSPTQVLDGDLDGRSLIQRTSAGTQGVVRSQNADQILVASFVNAGATARLIRDLSPASVTFVITGVGAGDQYNGPGAGDQDRGSAADLPDFGDEDASCADYIQALVSGEHPNPLEYLQRVLDSPPGRIYADPSLPEFPRSDLDLCTALDRFNFAMQVNRHNGLFILYPLNSLLTAESKDLP